MSKKKIMGVIVLLAFGAAVVVVGGITAWASTFSYAFSVTNNTSSPLTNIPFIVSISNTYLQSIGYEGTGVDTEVTMGGSKPHMVADDKVLAVADLSANTSSSGSYGIGGITSPTMPIVVGYGGYITTPDAPNLFNSANFSISTSAYVGAAGNFSEQAGAYALSDSGTGTITGNVTGTGNISVSQSNIYTDMALYGDQNRATQYLQSVAKGTVASASFYMEAWGSGIVGTANITIRQASDDSLLGILGTVNLGGLSVGNRSLVTGSNPVTNPIRQDLRISVEVPTFTFAAYPGVAYENNDTIYGKSQMWSSLTNYFDWGSDLAINYIITTNDTAVIATGISNGEKNISLTNNQGLLSLSVNSVLKDSVYGVSMNNSSSGIKWLEGIPYADSITYSVNGTQQLYYAPNTMIIGTTLPDRSADATNNDGTITWGTNPPGVTTTLGALTLVGQSAAPVNQGVTADNSSLLTDNPLMPVTMYTEMDTSNIPGGQAIDDILSLSGTPKAIWWYPFIFGIICIIGMTVYEATTAHLTMEGDYKVMAVTMECLLILFGVLGWTQGHSLIPLFPSFLFPIAATPIVMSRKFTGWG